MMFEDLQRDSLGVPKLSSEDIESIAEEFLQELAPSVLTTLTFTPLAYIFQTLEKRQMCTVSFDGDLGESDGAPRLGVYSMTNNHVTISRTLSKTDPRYSFTCAHELGHYALHQPLDPKALQRPGEVEIRDSARELMTYRVQGGPRSTIEWQANRFAASVLMPRVTLRAALARVQDHLGIGRRGYIHLDNQRRSQDDFDNTIARLSAHYKVSKAVVRVRLSEMSLINVAPSYGLAAVNEDLGKALHALFRY
jgi:Zn-dependent peptidase ImmA (M78 family)